MLLFCLYTTKVGCIIRYCTRKETETLIIDTEMKNECAEVLKIC
jgi:hypothetical protein